ncbi:hypothetical protein BH24DEI2_BH24DEI2_14940 [soil metagenome]
MNRPGRAIRFLGLFLVALSLAACSGGSTNPPDPPKDGTETYETVNGIPTITLSDGSTFVLDRLDLREALQKQFPAPPETAPQSLTTAALPARVDLRALQTPIKNQGGRGTCVAFATTATIEAAYKRERGLNLDLSEQYANHIQKMTALPQEPRTPEERETQLGAWGGSAVSGQLGWLFRLRFGLPTESAMAGIVREEPALTYIPEGSYENTNQPGDVPRLFWNDATLSQRTVDEWNLNPVATAYNIPERKTLTNFPRQVLSAATYGVSRVRAVERNNLTAIKAELAAGREVAFGISLTQSKVCKDGEDNPLPAGDACYTQQNADIANQYRGGVWRPVSDAWGGHAMVMVGYDDAKQVFIVKNSWGRDSAGKGRPAEADPDADGFIEMS